VDERLPGGSARQVKLYSARLIDQLSAASWRSMSFAAA